MADKLKEVVITKRCRVDGVHKEPGEHVEGPVHEMNSLIGMEKATPDLKWTPPEKPEAGEPKKGKGKGKE